MEINVDLTASYAVYGHWVSAQCGPGDEPTVAVCQWHVKDFFFFLKGVGR